MNQIKSHLPGLLLSFGVAAAAYFLGITFPIMGGPVIGIALGVLLASLWRLPEGTAKGIKFTSKNVLQLAVILLGFEMNLGNIIRVGEQSLLVLVATLSGAFTVAYLAGKYLKINRKVSTLIGVGTAICGGSAIAAASPVIEADDQEISYAISTIFFFNVIAVFLFPPLGHLLRLSDSGFGMWAGTAINDTSSVVAAGYSFSAAAGKFATIVKLTRSLMIVPVTLALAFVFAPENKSEGRFDFAKIFPWFIVGFLVAAVLRTTALIPVPLATDLALVGKFMIVAAMTAIGLNTNVQMFMKAGPRALLLGASTWFAVAILSLAMQFLTQLW